MRTRGYEERDALRREVDTLRADLTDAAVVLFNLAWAMPVVDPRHEDVIKAANAAMRALRADRDEVLK